MSRRVPERKLLVSGPGLSIISAELISRARVPQSPNCLCARSAASASGVPAAMASLYACSSCSANSETIAFSRSGPTCSRGRFRRTYWRQSGMAEPRELVEYADEFAPCLALHGECALPGGSETVESAPPFTCLLHPSALDELTPFEPVQERVERCNVELNFAFGLGFDQFGEFVSMAGAAFQQSEYNHLRATLLQVARGDISFPHIWGLYM